MPNGQWDTRISVNESKIDNIQHTVDRIETKLDTRLDRIDDSLDKKVSYKVLGLIITVMGMAGGAIFAVVKWSTALMAAVKG